MACLLPCRQVVRAWAALLAAAPAVGELETFRYDLVDVARQALSKRATAMWRVRCPVPAASLTQPSLRFLGRGSCDTGMRACGLHATCTPKAPSLQGAFRCSNLHVSSHVAALTLALMCGLM